MMSELPIVRGEIDVSLARRLVSSQFPQWADLPVRPVEFDGHDNRTFRLGADKTVRLPSAAAYAVKVEKEQRLLLKLAPHLPLPIPEPLAMGVPSAGYPWRWSIYSWIEGEDAAVGRIEDPRRFADSLAQFLAALQRIDPDGGPRPGKHNFFRGAEPVVYDGETREAIAALYGEIDSEAVTEVWETALRATWNGRPVWLHGDVSASNLLVKQGRLCAVIDFGGSAVGDPACDLSIAWTLFSGESREAFRAALPLDEETWARGRGWTLWKGLITLAAHRAHDPVEADKARHVINQVLADHQGAV